MTTITIKERVGMIIGFTFLFSPIFLVVLDAFAAIPSGVKTNNATELEESYKGVLELLDKEYKELEKTHNCRYIDSEKFIVIAYSYGSWFSEKCNNEMLSLVQNENWTIVDFDIAQTPSGATKISLTHP